MTNSQAVKDYYNDFNKSVMSTYRETGNARILKAFEFLRKHIQKDTKILDIGCGIGIIPEKIIPLLENGFIWAFDISEANIESARLAVNSDKVKFSVSDILRNFSSVEKALEDNKVDIITLIDVIEHLPPQEIPLLFENLCHISTNSASILLSYPSPEFQNFLYSEEPEKLQIIDESIDIYNLIKLAKIAGFSLSYFSYIDVWRKNQYIHCRFSKKLSINKLPRSEDGFWANIHKMRQHFILRFISNRH